MDYPSNSKTPDENQAKKDEAKKVEKVVEGDVVRRKKPLGKRFHETFIGGDDAATVWNYILMDILIPAAKDTVADATSQGIERVLFGEARSSSRRTGGKPRNGHVSYNRFSGGAHPALRNDRDRDIRPSRRARASHDFGEIILATRVEAEEVIDRLFDLVSKYGSTTVSDLYDLLGISGDYTDNKWGWTDMRGAGIERIRNGYLLDLPKPEPLEF